MKKFIALILSVILVFSISFSTLAATNKQKLPMKQNYSEYEYMTVYGCPIYNTSGQVTGYCRPGTYLASGWNNGIFILILHGNNMEFVPTDATVQGEEIYNYLANKNRNIVDYICVCDSEVIKVKKFTAKKVTGTSIFTNIQKTYDATTLEVYPIFNTPFYGPCSY